MARTTFAPPTQELTLRQHSSINLTPLVGVMLLLLAIFMIAAPGPTASIKIETPSAGWSDALAMPNEQVIINVEQDDLLYVGARPTSLETLVADVGSTVGPPRSTKQSVWVRANRSVSYGDFMIVINRLRKAGYEPRPVMEDL